MPLGWQPGGRNISLEEAKLWDPDQVNMINVADGEMIGSTALLFNLHPMKNGEDHHRWGC